MVGDVRRAGMSISDNDDTGMFPHNHLQGLQGMVWYENENTLLMLVTECVLGVHVVLFLLLLEDKGGKFVAPRLFSI